VVVGDTASATARELAAEHRFLGCFHDREEFYIKNRSELFVIMEALPGLPRWRYLCD
jgi:hypothetical protein